MTTIVHFEIPSDNIERAKKFYNDLFSWKMQKMPGPMEYWTFSNTNDKDGGDRMFGGDGNDVMIGEDGNDSMDGGDGNDRMFGFAGDDSMVGDAGDDSLD